MMKIFKIAAFLLLCACFAAAQTPATPQTATPNPQASTQVEKPMLEFANASQAKIAWTSKQGADLVLQYSTDPNTFNQAADAIEHSGGDNHRATLGNLQPNTTYYVRMTDKNGQPVGPVYSFKTPAQGQPPIHQQPLQAK
ncbi:MAG TPA: fibronectin type III domain-containing protein [Candidatus Angelobacter sp.]|nr:fibronectin type III domain-containing protein [Candidatus Angelobacter sp.]